MRQAAKILLFDANKNLLLFLRDNIPTIICPGCWDLIGGGIEENETPEEAIIREIKEEIEISVSDLILIDSLIVPEHDCEIFIFKGFFNKDISNIKLNEGQKLGLFSINKLPLNLYFRYIDFIKDNKEKIIFN